MTGRNSPREDLPTDLAVADASLLTRLPDRLRMALMLRDKAGLSDYAIAAHLRVGVSEVHGLITEARAELRRLRQDHPPTDAAK